MDSDRQDERPWLTSDGSDTARLETFADGVIAIAITLLILDVKVPEAHGAALRGQLAMQWPSYAGYVVSFLTIGVIWVNHHHMFKLIERTTHAFLIMNVVFLMTIAFLPWPTALVAANIRSPAGRETASVVYGVTMVAIAVMFNVVWRYASKGGRLMHPRVDLTVIARTNRSYGIGPIVYAAATVIAFVDAYVSLAIFAALAVFWLLPGTGPRTSGLLPADPAPD